METGALVRTHVLRPTWHVVAAEDLRWLLALTATRIQLASAGWFGRQGIDADAIRLSRAVFDRVLGGGRSLTREELGRALSEAGLVAVGPRLAGLMMVAELEGVVCSGPPIGSRQTYALLEERIAPTPTRSRDDALAELASRYVTGHGPAQAIDLSWWSGLTLREARRGLEAAGSSLARERHGDRELWSARSDARIPVDSSNVRLLPNWDELLVAFRDRSDAVDPGLPAFARAPVSLLSNVVVRDGLVVGTWRRDSDGDGLRVRATLHVPLAADERERLEQAAADLAAFLGRSRAAVVVD